MAAREDALLQVIDQPLLNGSVELRNSLRAFRRNSIVQPEFPFDLLQREVWLPSLPFEDCDGAQVSAVTEDLNDRLSGMIALAPAGLPGQLLQLGRQFQRQSQGERRFRNCHHAALLGISLECNKRGS